MEKKKKEKKEEKSDHGYQERKRLMALSAMFGGRAVRS